MDNYYSLLGIEKNASQEEIKKAFRERAKKIHPDIAGKAAESAMCSLLAAYEALSDTERRFKYDQAYSRFEGSFDYPAFLRERKTDPASQAKLLFYLLLHPGSEQFDSIEIWNENGALNFRLENYLDREDWMDCSFLLAEELDRRGMTGEAFSLMAKLAREEKMRPYFKHFMADITDFKKKLARKIKQNEKRRAKKYAI
jgi:hypothetical protein